MAHNIETMAWTGDKPWHGLGIEVAPDLTPLEMLISHMHHHLDENLFSYRIHHIRL